MVEDETLLGAAGRIADGEMVDWASITSSLRSDDDRAIADELALVAQIAAGHRQLHQLLPVATDTPPNLMAGRARWGHLDLLNIVGRGSYGTVYRAWDTRLERLVALKLFHGASNPDTVMQEGRMLARVRHENVVTVYGADVTDGVAGIWMELVHGKTLDNLVKGHGVMTAREAAAVGADVARALAAVHAAGLLHCDVKAQNVVRETTGRVVLMDLGAGRVAPEPQDGDQLSDIAGTPRYMAPELFRPGAAATKASDLYSFGVLLYFLVSGRFPVDGKTLGELKWAHAVGYHIPLTGVTSGLPAAFVDVVSRAIERDPARRPESASGMHAALAPIAAGATRSIGWWAAAAAGVGMVALLAIARPMLTPPAPPAPAIRSIAVLPIKNLTGDPQKAYVADGLTEVLISNLARIRSLRVPSFAAVAPLRDSTDTPSELSKRLGVQLLLAGSITQADARVRFNVHLVDATGAAIWGEEISRENTSVMAAQAEIVRRIAERLALGSAEALRGAQSQAALSPKAQDAYLQGLALTNAGPSRAAEANRRFREAVEIEPRFAAAWAELALAENRVLATAPVADREARAAFVREVAGKAIELDPEMPAGYAALANEQFYYEWDFPSAERNFRRALEVGPSHAFTRQFYAMFLAATGRLDEALSLAMESRAIEPMNPARTHAVAMIHYYRREYDKAITEMRNALSLSSGFPVAHFGLGRSYSALGRQADAAREIERALKAGRTSGYLIELARVYLAARRLDDYRRVMAELVDREKQGDRYNLDNLAYHAAVEGRVDDAFRILEEARTLKMVNMLWIAVDPRVDVLRSDSRFEQLLRRMKLIP